MVQGEDHGTEQRFVQLGLGPEAPIEGTNSNSALPAFNPSQQLLCKGVFSSGSQKQQLQVTPHG